MRREASRDATCVERKRLHRRRFTRSLEDDGRLSDARRDANRSGRHPSLANACGESGREASSPRVRTLWSASQVACQRRRTTQECGRTAPSVCIARRALRHRQRASMARRTS